jgi:hypothetical protein
MITTQGAYGQRERERHRGGRGDNKERAYGLDNSHTRGRETKLRERREGERKRIGE